MSSSKSNPTIYDRIHHVETELKALSADAIQDGKARKMLIGVSQHTINTLELGPDAIWRIFMQVFNHIVTLPPSDLGYKLALYSGSSKTLILRLTVMCDSPIRALP